MVSLSLVPVVAAAEADTLVPPPEAWQSYFGNRAGYPALIVYNKGLAGHLDRIADKSCLILTFPLKAPNPEGLPLVEEGKTLFQLDDAFEPVIAAHDTIDLGRVTMNGKRHVFMAAGENAAILGEALVQAAARFGYPATFQIERGAVREVFEVVLSPTEDEYRLIRDEWVLRQLAENGDIAAKTRKVDHWAYFRSRVEAEAFARWAVRTGFDKVSVAKVESRLPFQVKSSHQGTMEPGAVSEWTLLQDRKARELGGEYDGWETEVMR